jgi:hypothetical protein
LKLKEGQDKWRALISRNGGFSSQAAEGKAFFGYSAVPQRLGIRCPKPKSNVAQANNVLQVFSFVLIDSLSGSVKADRSSHQNRSFN